MTRWLRYFEFFRRDPRRDIDDEIRAHLELRQADLVAQGFTPEVARARAQREFGDAAAVRETTVRVDERMMRREHRAEWWDTITRDVRVALRSLRANPGFAVSAIVCAAAGIGITAAIVSASYSVLMRSLPYRDSDRLVAIYAENTQHDWHGVNVSWGDFASWRDNNRAFQDGAAGVAIWTWTTNTLTSAATAGDDAERIYGAYVSWNLFRVLGVSPIIGRNFLPEEDAPGRNHEIIISHRLWTRRFGSDSALVGKTLQLDGRPWTVIGVMPPGFNFPDRGDAWEPFAADPNESHGNRQYAGAIGRLAPGVSVEQARADLHRIDADLEARFRDENLNWRAEVMPLRDDLVGNLRDPLKVLLAAVGLVLLLACINVANLMLARGASRAREIAIRSALGASRERLVRQLMTESLVVALAGGALGVGVAALVIRLVRAAFPGGLPFYITLGVDRAALAMVAAITIVTAILFGIIPAIRGSRADLNASLRDGARGGSGVDKARLRNALVVGEIALSAVLLTAALLLMRTYRNLHETPLGFTEQGIATAQLTLPRNAGYPTATDVQRFYARLFERLRNAPNVASVGAAQGIPFTGWDVQGDVHVEGEAPAPPGQELSTHFQYVSADYFKTMGVSLVSGRWLDASDADTLNLHVLITQQLVAKAFHGAEPLGKRVRIGRDPWATVVGVIQDYHHYRLPEPPPPAIFYSTAAYTPRQMTIAIRAKSGDPHDLVPLLRSAVREIDPQVALFQVQTMDEVVMRMLWRQRLMGNVLGTFAALALAMACVGLYGVVSYAVSQRTREIGVRVALGATRGTVLRLVLGHGTRLVMAGIAAGLVAAYFAMRILQTLLYGVHATDPMTFGIVALGLTAVALLAAAIPSRRATRVDPIIAMRAE
ncbi:MAG TPA: ABC transporter permease [Gemmatimonadaceae bacterium]|nr:ABC transporter permease [Gemmatimonadaceae bacterium]